MTEATITQVEISDDMKAMLAIFERHPRVLPGDLPEGWDDKRGRATVFALTEAGYDIRELPTPAGDCY